MKRMVMAALGVLSLAGLLYFGQCVGGCSGTTMGGGSSGGSTGASTGSSTGDSSGGGDTGAGGGTTGGSTTGGGPSSTPVTGSGTLAANNGFSQQSLSVGGVNRKVDIFAPAGRGGTPALVIAFHGTSGTSEDWIDSDPGSDPQGLESLATTHGFVIAAPQARDWGDGASDWDNHNGNDRYWETRFDATPACGSDPTCNADLVLVKQIISSTHAAYNVDLKRVYLIGFSNGAFFSELAAMALRDQIAAFAEAAGGLVKCDHTDSCTFQSSSTSCATIGSGCSCSGAEKPIVIPTSGRLVPGFLGHHNQDDGVSSYYTCSLLSRMQGLGYDASVFITNETGHGIPTGFIDAAWSFFSTRSLP